MGGPNTPDGEQWYDEVYEGSMRFGLRVKQVLFEQQSDFQKVSIVESETLGRALMLDGLWMTAEGDEATYHEMLVHPALTTAPRIKRVLIIGGGDGGTAREVLRYPEVEHVDMVEIDGMVVDSCKQFLGTIGTAWEDPRLNVVIGDGVAWAREADVAPYDVILVDGSDPVGPAVGLFDDAFYAGCRRLLAADGVLATQCESPRFQRQVHVDMVLALRRAFGKAYPYYGPVGIYPGGAWSWAYASSVVDPMAFDPARVARVEGYADYYNRDIHRGAFAVPNALRRRIL